MIMSFFLPVVPLCLLVGGAILSDTILGVWGAKRRGEKITSRKLSAIIPKMLLYQAAVLSGYVVDVWLVGEFLSALFSIDMLMTKMIALTLLYIEGVSIDENFESITNKNLFKSFKELISRANKIKEL